jgi:hypothetical protein
MAAVSVITTAAFSPSVTMFANLHQLHVTSEADAMSLNKPTLYAGGRYMILSIQSTEVKLRAKIVLRQNCYFNEGNKVTGNFVILQFVSSMY